MSKSFYRTVLGGLASIAALTGAASAEVEIGAGGGVHVFNKNSELGVADIKREGTDVTVVAIAGCVNQALKAAEALAAEGISVEVLDPRTLVPLDRPAILASVAKTGRLVIADVTHRTCGVAAEISATVAEDGFATL